MNDIIDEDFENQDKKIEEILIIVSIILYLILTYQI